MPGETVMNFVMHGKDMFGESLYPTKIDVYFPKAGKGLPSICFHLEPTTHIMARYPQLMLASRTWGLFEFGLAESEGTISQ